MPEPTTSILKLRVSPNASRSEVAEWHGDALRVRVSVPPEGGKANVAVIDTLAERLGIHRRDVEIVRGRSSRDKVALVSGLDSVEVMRRLGAPSSSSKKSRPQ